MEGPSTLLHTKMRCSAKFLDADWNAFQRTLHGMGAYGQFRPKVSVENISNRAIRRPYLPLVVRLRPSKMFLDPRAYCRMYLLACWSQRVDSFEFSMQR